MHYAKLIHEYLDEGLDSSREDMLFSELAANPEIREEFNRQVKLHLFAQNDMGAITPPIEVTYGVFSSLGFSIPSETYLNQYAGKTEKPSKYASMLNFWKRNLTAMSITLLLATFGGYVSYNLSAGNGVFGFGKSNPENLAQKSAIPVAGSFESSDLASGNTAQQDRNANNENATYNIDKTADSDSNIDKAANNPNTGKRFDLNAGDAGSPANGLTRDKSDIANAASQSAPDNMPVLVFSAPVSLYSGNSGYLSPFGSTNESNNIRLLKIVNSLKLPGGATSDEILTNPESISRIDDTRFIIQFRGINPDGIGSTGGFAGMQPSIDKMSFAVLYKLDDYHAVGIEAGTEHFLQEFKRNIGGKEWTQIQNPQLFWYGVAYRFSGVDYLLPYIFYPYAQVFVGGVSTGALARAQAGFQLKLGNNFGFTAGYEFREHIFNVDNKLYLSPIHGLVYGVNVNF